MTPRTQTLSNRSILRFWLPLQATWLMMAAEGPFLAALIARLAGAKLNLAAYGVALSLAMIVEAPIIMMLSAATALVGDRQAYLKLRRFAFALNAAITAAMLVILWPPVFSLLARRWIGLPPDVARLTWRAALLLVPWPAAIGYRRFFQGVLIRSGNTGAVAAGTLVRLTTMAATGLALALWARLPGAVIGAAALAAGVLGEAAASRFMARHAVRRLLAEADGPGRGLTLAAVWRFYLPLALTSFLTLAVHPLISFFLARSRQPLESLAVLPVINAMAFIFRAPGIAFQEAVIALLGPGSACRHELRRFAVALALGALAAMAAVTWTPLAHVWLRTLSGLAPELARFAVWPARIVTLLPLLEALISLQRGALVYERRTAPIIAATALQVAALAALLGLLVFASGWSGARAAAAAQAGGAITANLFLCFCLRRYWRRQAD